MESTDTEVNTVCRNLLTLKGYSPSHKTVDVVELQSTYLSVYVPISQQSLETESDSEGEVGQLPHPLYSLPTIALGQTCTLFRCYPTSKSWAQRQTLKVYACGKKSQRTEGAPNQGRRRACSSRIVLNLGSQKCLFLRFPRNNSSK